MNKDKLKLLFFSYLITYCTVWKFRNTIKIFLTDVFLQKKKI